MDWTAPIDPMLLGLVLLCYAGVGAFWLTLALRTNRRD
jgi:hypothetical protein